jgi:hypothetical protein
MIDSDFDTLDNLLGDGLIYTHSTGQSDTRAEYIAQCKKGVLKYRKIERPAVEFSPPRWLYAPPGIYVVTAKLPERDGEFEYHIKHTKEFHEPHCERTRAFRGPPVTLSRYAKRTLAPQKWLPNIFLQVRSHHL